MQLNSGAKVWLWIIFVLNIVSVALTAVGLPGVMLLFDLKTLLVSILGVVLSVIVIVGIGILLFRQKKIGFYLICTCAVAGLIVNIIIGNGIIWSAISAVVSPLITYLFLKSQWEELA